MLVNFSTVSFNSGYAPKKQVNFQGLSLIQTRGLYNKALREGYAIPAFNFSNLENLEAIVKAAIAKRSPLIAQVSEGARKYAGEDVLIGMVNVFKKQAAKENVPVMLHLDHGGDFDIAKKCVDAGFDSVMIDGSKYGFDENVRLTKQVVDYAHAYKEGVFVEAELGKLAGVEDNVSSKTSLFTDPKEAAEFVKATGIDSLAISIGTSHGPVKFRPDEKPELDFKRLSQIKAAVEKILPANKGWTPNSRGWTQFPFVLHGASSAPADLIAKINSNVVIPRSKMEVLLAEVQGTIAKAKLQETMREIIAPHMEKVTGKGVPEEMYSEAVKRGIAKVNVDTDFRLDYTATIKDLLANKPKTVDPRDYGKPVKAALQGIGERKIDMLGSANKA